MSESITEKWMRTPVPRVIPAPEQCAGERRPVLCLNGPWEVTDYRDGSVRQIEVPFDMDVLRKDGSFSRHYAYRRSVELPHAAPGSRFILQFEAVNGFAEVYADGVCVASHENGFLTWNAEITAQAAGREKLELRVELDEENDTVSAYSHGGILRDVYLYVLPERYIDAVYLTPLFDEDMEQCTVRVDLGVAPLLETAGETGAADEKTRRPEEEKEDGVAYTVQLTLFSPDGMAVGEKAMTLETCIDGYYTAMLPVPEAVLWDAEHPFLYRVQAVLCKGGAPVETVSRKVGLRRIERRGNRVMINGQEIKLRGVCRHEIAPHRGRSLTRDWIERDVALFKEANCNYIRTSHYPPSAYFLDLCDENGIYVEDELALAFIARSLPYSQRDPEQTARYLSHFAEIVARDYNHPSVLIWSLCNESFGGFNFDLLNRYAHRKDPTRMTKFSYPMTMQEEHELPDIWSIHYSEYTADLAKKHDNLSLGHAPGRDLPVLHDEYIHVACYNREELRRDPALRSFWGEGARIFWDRIWETEGALGGAIWAGIDETDIYDGGNTQLEWGIIDIWRRRKPEFYLTRKAYTPVKLLHAEVLPREGRALLLLENRFCHTDLSEVRMDWRFGARSGSLFLPAARPGRPVKLLLPLGESGQALDDAEAEKNAPSLFVSFWDARGGCVDEALIGARGAQLPALLPEKGVCAPLRVTESDGSVEIAGDAFSVRFDKESGLIASAQVGGEPLLTGGPVLNAPYLRLGAWKKRRFDWRQCGDAVQLETAGAYEGTMELTWTFRVCPDGGVRVAYRIDRLDGKLPDSIKMRVGVDDGGLDELGVAFFADASMDSLSFRRRLDADAPGCYAWYPQDHISRTVGTARCCGAVRPWGQTPENPWSTDAQSDILNGRFDVRYTGTPDFTSTKDDVAEAYLYGTGAHAALGVRRGECGPSHLRLEVLDPENAKIPDGDSRIRYVGTWYSQEDANGSDHGTEHWSREKGAYAEVTFHGTGIVWYGPQDTVYGKANVYLDGALAAERISQRSAGCDFSCSSVGFDKKYHLPVFSAQGLAAGEHTLRIEVLGEKAADASDCYIVIDYLRVLGERPQEPVKVMVNQAYAFPHISWGNYRKPPIRLQAGDGGEALLRLVYLPDETADEALERAVERAKQA